MTSIPEDLAISVLGRGSQVGRFVIVAELGAGGMGVVFAAHDPMLDRQVALKVMRGAGDDAEEDRGRMLREGQAMARVTHPNVITVYEVGELGSMVFLAQELLDGGTLAQWLAQPHAQRAILDKFIAAGRGLAAAHAAGLVHRDFKPDNVLLGKDGRVRVADFGLARALGTDALVGPTQRGGGPPREDSVTRSPMDRLTRTGAVMGTPMFMAPEQHEGRRADERSDQFAFCVALYHALYGDWPFAGKTAIALADNVINGVLQPPPPNKKVSPRLRKILLRGLSVDPAARYPSMDALLAELESLPRRGSGKRIALAVGAAVLVAGAAVTAFVVLDREEQPRPKVVETPKPRPVVVGENLAIDQDTVLVQALDNGYLQPVMSTYEREAALLEGTPRAAIAHAAAAFTHALRGDLRAADARLKQASASKSSDPRAGAFVDLATAAIAAARGEIGTALDHGHRCAEALAKSSPLVAAICLQIKGEVSADAGKRVDAAAALERAHAIAKQADNAELASALELAQLRLELDDKQHEVGLERVIELQDAADVRGGTSAKAAAMVLAARIRNLRGEQNTALDELRRLDFRRLQIYRLGAMARIAIGEIYGYKGEGNEEDKTGLDMLDEVIADAKSRDFTSVLLEAKLARVRVKLTLGDEDAEEARTALIGEANARGYKRIARLAETYLAKTAEPQPTEP